MPIRYFHPVDEDQCAAQGPIGCDEPNNDWWSGVFKSAVGIALSAVLAATTLAATINGPNLGNGVVYDPEEIPAGSLHQLDEFYYSPTRLQLDTPWIVPLFGTANDANVYPLDEDFWINPVRPVPASMQTLAGIQGMFPYLPDPEELHVPQFVADEDYWIVGLPLAQPRASPTILRFVPGTAAFIPAYTLDEDSWQNLVVPVASYAVPRVFTDDEVVPAHFVADEDFWAPGAPPPPPAPFVQPSIELQHDQVPASAQDEDYCWPVWPQAANINLWPQQFVFEQNDFVTQVDEDFWQPPLPLAVRVPVVAFTDTDEAPYLGKDEDFWVNQVPSVASYPVPRVFTDDDVAMTQAVVDDDAGTPVLPPTTAPRIPQAFTDDEVFVTTFDEDFWTPLAVTWPARVVLPITDDEVIGPEGVLESDEDVWQSDVAPVFAYQIPRAFTDDDEFTSTFDEDFWQNFVAPTPAVLIWPQQFAFNSVDFVTQVEEDFWVNAVPPIVSYPAPKVFTDDDTVTPEAIEADEEVWVSGVPPVVYIAAPKAFSDDEEFTSTFDEDYWQNPTAPVKAALGPLYLPDPEELPAHSLHGQPDEDFWQNPVAPLPATLYQALPYLPDREDTIFGQFTKEEELWQNPTPPVWWLNNYPQQWTFDVQDPAGKLYGQFDEDFWQSGVAPVVGYVIPKAITDDDPFVSRFDEDYWQNPTAPQLCVYTWPQQFTFDQSEFITRVDEDYWQLLVAPACPAVPKVFSDDEVTIPEAIEGDEEAWQNLVAPVAGYLVPRAFTDDDVFVSTVEEDFWVSGVVPVFTYQQPTLFTADELFTPSAAFEEDAWQNRVAPVASYASPVVFTDDDTFELPYPPDEDFWHNAVAPIPATLYQPLPYLPDPEVLFLPAAPGEIVLSRLVAYNEITEFKLFTYGQIEFADVNSIVDRWVLYKAQSYPQMKIAAVRSRLPEIGEYLIRGLNDVPN